MVLTFILISIAGMAYFALTKRHCDCFTVAYFAACIYFLPGFCGYTLYPSNEEMVPVDLFPSTYVVFDLVLVSIWLSALAYDASVQKHKFKTPRRQKQLPLSIAALSLACIGLTGAVITIGLESMLYGTKIDTIDEYANRWFALYEMCSLLGFVFAFAERRRTVLMVAALLLAGDMFLGFRVNLGVAFIATALLVLSKEGESRVLVRHYKSVLALLVAAMGLLAYKGLYEFVRNQEWSTISVSLSDPAFYLRSVFTSEPFVIQSILNETIGSHVQSAGFNLLTLFYFSIPFVGDLTTVQTLGAGAFNAQALFPGLIFGVGSNVWAEMLSYGDWPLLVGFIVVFNLCLAWGSYLLRTVGMAGRCVTAVTMSFWAFYFHRSSVLFEHTLLKRVFICFAMSYVLAIALGFWRRQQGAGGSPRPAKSLVLEPAVAIHSLGS